MIEEQKEEEKRAGARNELWQDLWNERSLVGSLLCTLFENLKFCSNSININSNFFKFRGKLNEFRINLTNDWLLNTVTDLANSCANPLFRRPQGSLGCLEKGNQPLS